MWDGFSSGPGRATRTGDLTVMTHPSHKARKRTIIIWGQQLTFDPLCSDTAECRFTTNCMHLIHRKQAWLCCQTDPTGEG